MQSTTVIPSSATTRLSILINPLGLSLDKSIPGSAISSPLHGFTMVGFVHVVLGVIERPGRVLLVSPWTMAMAFFLLAGLRQVVFEIFVIKVLITRFSHRVILRTFRLVPFSGFFMHWVQLRLFPTKDRERLLSRLLRSGL